MNNETRQAMEYDRTVGEKAEFDCMATGVPTPSVKWIKHNQAIELVSYRLFNKEERPVWKLQMQNLLLADSGNYTCLVSNGRSKITRSFVLAVKGMLSKPKHCKYLYSSMHC